jgi:hypothetical protein
MNREQSGNSFKRIHLSFHSNAGGGRGAIGLITSTPTTNQARFAQLCGAEVNADLAALGSPPLEVAWPNRSTSTFTGVSSATHTSAPKSANPPSTPSSAS